MGPRAGSILLAAVIAGAGPVAADQALIDAVADLTARTALVEARRVYLGNEVMTYGTAVFVHPDGYLLTDAAAVGDLFPATRIAGGSEIEAPALAITVLARAADGSLSTRPGQVVGIDKRTNLALVSVEGGHPAVLDIGRGAPLPSSGPIRVLGFNGSGTLDGGFGPNLTDPQVTVIPGSATRLVRDQRSRPVHLETDIAVDAGHCGGLLLDAEHRPSGIAVCDLRSGHLLARAVPLDHAFTFLVGRTLRLEATPGLVLDPPQPIHLEVRQAFALPEVAAWTMKAAISHGDVPLASLPLAPGDDGGWAGVFDPSSIDLDGVDRITVRLLATDSEGRPRYARRHSLDVIPPGFGARSLEQAALAPTPTPAPATPTPEPRMSLSDIAGDTEVSTSVIDNRRIEDVDVAVEVEDIPDERFEHLSSDAAREAARDFDTSVLRIAALERALDELAEMERSDEISRKVWAKKREELYREMRNERERAQRLHSRLIAVGVCLCSDRKWYHCTSAGCFNPFTPEPPSRY